MSCNNEVAVSVRGRSKAYKIFESPGKRLCYHLFKVQTGRDFWALDNINFDIRKGEAFGIIGKNGSGKSTMLQILAGIIKATTGDVVVNGKIAALLELGSGFNPENTGYENIYMNAAILGVTKKEIERKIDEIIEFADIGSFINQPVKTYSSGMYIRLAFAVAINVNADIILIDEALAVGDLFFRQKCYAKLNCLKEEGKTIILVTHGMGEVEQFCDRAVLLHKGKQIDIGRSQEIVKQYYLLDQESEEILEEPVTVFNKEEDEIKTKKAEFSDWKIGEYVFYNLSKSREIGNGKAEFLQVGLFDDVGNVKRVFQQGEMAYFYMEIKINKDMGVPVWGVVLYDNRNTIVHGKDSLQYDMELPHKLNAGTIIRILQKIKLDVSISDYSFEVAFGAVPYEDYIIRSYRSQEESDQTVERICARNQVGSFSVIPRKMGAPMKIGFHGACDVPGSMEFIVE